MLTDRITLAPTAELEPEDYFSSALGVIFPDDITNQHGDPSTPVIYTSPTYGKIFLNLADPVGEDSRRLFAQYLWNAGVYMAVALEDAVEGTVHGEGPADQEENSTARDKRKGADEDESRLDTRYNAQSTDNIIRPLIDEITDPQTLPNIVSHEEKSPWDVRDETVLELGAGTGLAGIIAAKAGAKHVLITDYPAPEVLANLKANVERNLSPEERGRCRIVGHEWGVVPDGESGVAAENSKDRENVDSAEDDHDRDQNQHQHHQKFTRILVADCLWMPSQHRNLHRSIAYYLSPSSSSPTPLSTPPPSSSSSSSSSISPTSSSSSTTHNQTHTHTHPTSSRARALIVAGFHTGLAKTAPFFDERALSAAGLCLESIVERDAEGRERPWMWSPGRDRGNGGGGGGGGRGGEGQRQRQRQDGAGGGGGRRGGDGDGGRDIGEGEGELRAGIAERKRWLVVAVLKKL